MWLFKSTVNSAIALGIQRCLLAVLLLIALFRKVRDTLTRGLFALMGYFCSHDA